MSVSYNRIALMGNVVRDPETRHTQSGKAVTRFALAVNNPKSKEANFFDIVAWDRLGERCSTYLKKGTGAFVNGRLVIRSYEDKAGTKRKVAEIVIDDLQMLGGHNGKSTASTTGRAASSKNGTTSSRKAKDPEFEEDQFPFE